MLINIFAEDYKIGIPYYLCDYCGPDCAILFIILVHIFDESLKFEGPFKNALTLNEDYLLDRTHLSKYDLDSRLKKLETHLLINLLHSYIDDYYLIQINVDYVKYLKKDAYLSNQTHTKKLRKENCSVKNKENLTGFSNFAKELYLLMRDYINPYCLPEVLLSYCEPFIQECERKIKCELALDEEFWDFFSKNHTSRIDNNKNINDTNIKDIYAQIIIDYCEEKMKNCK